MNIEQWEIGRLKPFHNNSRVHDEKNLKAINASIDRFDWLQPIVVDKDGVIVMGHGRLEAAKQLGLEQVPVLVADWLTDNEAAAAREADNMTQDLSFFDMDLLNENLEQIDWLDCDMTQFGFYLDHAGEELEVDEAVNEYVQGTTPFARFIDEESNYVVLKFRTEKDWLNASSVLGLRNEQALPSRKDGNVNEKFKFTGLGRVVDGVDAMRIIIENAKALGMMDE
jgi:site-specific DNA-methyltransferase (adenine-specific)